MALCVRAATGSADGASETEARGGVGCCTVSSVLRHENGAARLTGGREVNVLRVAAGLVRFGGLRAAWLRLQRVVN